MSICVEIAVPTSIPDTTKTQLNGGNDVVLPADVKAILAIVPCLAVDAGVTAAKAIVSKCTIESDDIKTGIAPLEVLCNPIGAGLGNVPGVFSGTPQKYAVNVPVNGGERLRVYGTGLVDSTTDPKMSCAIVCSTVPPTAPQRYGKVGTLTATSGTTAVAASGGTITFSGGLRMVEVMGLLAAVTTTTLEGFSGVVELTSTEFVPNLPFRFPVSPVSSGIGTAVADLLAPLARYPVDVGLKSPTTIESFGTAYATTITSAPKFVAGFMYE